MRKPGRLTSEAVAPILVAAVLGAATLGTTSASNAQADEGSAHANSPAEERVAESSVAADQVAAARDAAAAGHLALARDLLRRALEEEPAAATAFNLALVLRNMGELVEAVALFEALLRETHGPVPEDRRARAVELLRETRAGLGTLLVRVDGVPDAEVRLDGVVVGRTVATEPLRLRADPGEHRIGVIALGRLVEERSVTVGRGAIVPVRIAVGARPNASAPPVSHRADGSDGSVWTSPWLWIALGVVVAGAVVGGIVFATSGDQVPDGFLGTARTLRIDHTD